MRHFVHDGHALVLSALRSLVQRDEPDGATITLIIEETQSTDWASATFVGQQHRIDVRLEGESAAVGSALIRVRDGIAGAQADSDRHFLADAALAGAMLDSNGARATARLTVEALTLEA